MADINEPGRHGRRTCATMDVHRRLLRTDERYRRNRLAIEQFTARYVRRNFRAGLRAGIVKIPVVVHVVWNTPAQNISDAQIASQIEVLNLDFRKLNPDVGTVPGAFAPLAADARIEFALAKRDPFCGPTTGITRTETSVAEFDSETDDIKFAAMGGVDAWPTDRYLNIWVAGAVAHPTVGLLLGYAQFPGGPAATDGVVIAHDAFGTEGTAAPPFDLGRTATHEIGHWFNLLHIWGDDTDQPDPCSGSDEVTDTPNQFGPNFACPGFPHVSCTNGPDGDMFMNYMDYVNDDCMTMFTAGQAVRMDAALFGPRASLLASDALVPPVNAAGPDLWSQDDGDDVGDEPNTTTVHLWQSHDIWVRRQDDGVVNQEHQNPEFRDAGSDPNFVYVRVRNRSCDDGGEGEVKLYWAKASTALGWPAPWDASVNSPALMGDAIGAQPTGVIPANEAVILKFSWFPPNPADYASFGADQAHFCLLARIETSSTAPFGMTSPEGSDLSENVQNNNNIAWKNITIVDEQPGAGRRKEASVVVSGTEAKALHTLVFADVAGERSMFEAYRLEVRLPPKLYTRWQEAGGKGEAIDTTGTGGIRLLKSGASIAGVPLEPKEFFTIRLLLSPASPLTAAHNIFVLDLTHFATVNNAETLVGGQRFVMKTAATPGTNTEAGLTKRFDGSEWIDAARLVEVEPVDA